MTTSTFFDVYSSPLVRCFFSSLVDSSCSVRLPKFINSNVLINKQPTRYENVVRLVVYETVIDGYVIKFQFNNKENHTDVEFFVNNNYQKCNASKLTKLAITKWLLSVWQIEKDNHSKFICKPCGEKGGFRGNYYSRFGFEWIDQQTMVLIK